MKVNCFSNLIKSQTQCLLRIPWNFNIKIASESGLNWIIETMHFHRRLALNREREEKEKCMNS